MALCLRSIKENEPAEIIVVDGNSSDDTVAIAKKYTDHVISDGGKGLGAARRIGTEAAQNPLIAMVSPDNVMPKESLAQLAKDLEKNNWVAVEPQVRVLLDNDSTYWDRAWDYNLFLDLIPGERPVVGTPNLSRRDALLKYSYDDAAKTGEDTDICEKWRRDGLKVGCGSTVAYEKQRLTFRGFRARWIWYGTGDAFFIWNWRATPRVSIRHFLHPLRTYMILRPLEATFKGRPDVVPFLFLGGVFRYVGMFKTLPKLIRKKQSPQPPTPILRKEDKDGVFGRELDM